MLGEGNAPGGAGVVDQDVEVVVIGGDGIGQVARPSSVERSAGMAVQVPCSESSAAVASQASALRDDTITVAPPATNPPAIMRPIPRVPPVITTVLPSTEKRSVRGSVRRPWRATVSQRGGQRRWQVGQWVVPRASTTDRRRVVPQRLQGCPARP